MRARSVVGAALLGLSVACAAAQDFPTKPITFVVPFPPGGGTDAMARTVAERMSRTLGQQVVVENRGGAGGTIGTRAVSKAAPDGYTILLSYTGTFAINPTLYTNAGYDPRKDFTPIGIIGLMPSVLVVHPSVPARTTAELIAYGKANPGNPDSAIGGTSGSSGERSAVVTASACSLPPFTFPMIGAIERNIIDTWPPIRLASASPLPL